MDQAVTNHEKPLDPKTADQEPQYQLQDHIDQEPRLLAPNDASETDSIVPTTKLQFLVIFLALILAIFCVALDNTIIVTAIPRITDDYRTLNDVGW